MLLVDEEGYRGRSASFFHFHFCHPNNKKDRSAGGHSVLASYLCAIQQSTDSEKDDKTEDGDEAE